MNGLLEKNASESVPIATLPIGTYREIPLTQGKVAIVDPEDYEWLNQWKWCSINMNGDWYAIRGIWKDGKSKSCLMHRLILQAPDGMDVDHIGLFASEIDAAKAYDEAAKKYHGAFANLNLKGVTSHE